MHSDISKTQSQDLGARLSFAHSLDSAVHVATWTKVLHWLHIGKTIAIMFRLHRLVAMQYDYVALPGLSS